jgi:hypothetical protein
LKNEIEINKSSTKWIRKKLKIKIIRTEVEMLIPKRVNL